MRVRSRRLTNAGLAFALTAAVSSPAFAQQPGPKDRPPTQTLKVSSGMSASPMPKTTPGTMQGAVTESGGSSGGMIGASGGLSANSKK